MHVILLTLLHQQLRSQSIKQINNLKEIKMSHFAQIDENNIVTQVIVIEQDVVDTGLFGDPNSWIQTSYNTSGGVHTQGGTPLRKNYAGIGYTYDSTRDAFIPPQPFNSWVLNEDTCLYEAPTPMPDDGKMYSWDEDTTSWVEIITP
jgi:hypothetical protein